MTETGIKKPERSIVDIIVYYLSVLWHYRLLIVIVTGAITVGVTLFCVVSILLPPDKSPLPNVYEADATILVQQSDQADVASSIMSALGVSQGGQASNAQNDNGDLVIEVLNSRKLLDALADEFGIAQKYGLTKNAKGSSREIVKRKIRYTYNRSNGAMKISSQDIDPVFAKNFVNKTVSLLDSWFSQNRGLEKQKQRQNLEDKITEVKASIDNLQTKLKSLQKRYGVLNVQELGQTQASSLANLRSQLILKDVEIKNYTSFSKIDDPRLEQLKAERQNLVDLINQNQQKLPDTDSSTGPPGTQTFADVAQQFSQLSLELDIQQKIYNTLSPQYEAAKLAPESEPIFQILELADVPDIKSGPQRPKIMAVALVMSLLGSIALSIAISALRKMNLKRLKEIITGGA
jgi:capsule polysaccharide export protein KpsE/RkpR